MSERMIKVPEGMMEAARLVTQNDEWITKTILQAALLWLSENPIVPTEQQWDECCAAVSRRYTESVGPSHSFRHAEITAEFQRRMFLASEVDQRRAGIVAILSEVENLVHLWNEKGDAFDVEDVASRIIAVIGDPSPLEAA